MPVILLKFLRSAAPYIAAAVLLLGVVLYIAVLRHDLSTAHDKNIALTQANLANVAAIAAYKTQEARWNAELDALDARMLATSKASGQIIDKINQAPASDDGVVAPVLANALDSLRALHGGAP